MRFLFRGLLRQSAKPVEGHVEAPDTEAAYQALSDNGIVTEALREDPVTLNTSPVTPGIPEFADALESAIDSSSSQVPFDDLTERYQGKKVWVIDRDKIRQRVAQIVDSSLAASEAGLESSEDARQRVANAIRGLFADTRNIASEHNAASIAGMRVPGANPAGGGGAVPDHVLEQQIGRLTGVVEQAEGLIAAMAAAIRTVESVGSPRRRMVAAPSNGPEQNEVLHEIFQSNLDLRRAIANEAASPAVNAAGTK